MASYEIKIILMYLKEIIDNKDLTEAQKLGMISNVTNKALDEDNKK